MKKFFWFVFLFASVIAAQEAGTDTTFAQAADTVNIRALVQEQINKAIDRQATGQTTSSLAGWGMEKIQVEPVKKEQPKQVEQQANPVWQIIIGQPLQVKIFELGSLLIIGFVLLRRAINSLRKKSLRALKEKIALLRNEKVAAVLDLKLQNIRKELSGNEVLFNKSEKQMARKAKELKISKGELQLAARLRLLEVGKM